MGEGPISNAHCFPSHSAADTWALGRALGEALVEWDDSGVVIALDGELGAGKTGFVKGLAEGLGLSAEGVSSPTFVLAHQYPGDGFGLHHIDLYRIEHEAELAGFGFDELLDPPHVAAIEWSCRFPQALPPDRLSVRIERGGLDRPEARRVLVSAGGARSEVVVRAWQVIVGRWPRSHASG